MPKRVPSYRLHKPSGQAVVTLGGKDFGGTRHLGSAPEASSLSHSSMRGQSVAQVPKSAMWR